MKRKLQLLFVVFFCVYAHIVWAAEYYVDYVSGNDKNPGTEVEPWKYAPGMTKADASNKLSAGDTVYLKKGQVWASERLTLKYDGSAGSRITYASKVGWGSGNLPEVEQIYHHEYVGEADYNTLDGLRVKNDAIAIYGYYDGIHVRDIDNLEIKNCYIYECALNTTRAAASSDYECGSRGIYGDPKVTNIVIENCTIKDNTGDGILIRDSIGGAGRTANITIKGCSITGNCRTAYSQHQKGMTVGGAGYVIVEKNYVYDNGYYAGGGISAQVPSGGTLYVRHNWVELNREWGITTKLVTGATGYIYGNVTYNNEWCGIQAVPRNKYPGGEFYIYNNVMAGHMMCGALIATGNTVEFKNNIVYDNGKWSDGKHYRAAQVTFDEWYNGQDSPVDHLTMDNNLITENTYNPSRTIQILGYPNYPNRKDFSLAEWIAYDHDGDSSADFDQNSVSSDPAFTDYSSKDFTLAPSSPCIDAAANLSPTLGYALTSNGTSFTTNPPTVLLVEQDHDGKWDIGAFSTVSSALSPVKNLHIVPGN